MVVRLTHEIGYLPLRVILQLPSRGTCRTPKWSVTRHIVPSRTHLQILGPKVALPGFTLIELSSTPQAHFVDTLDTLENTFFPPSYTIRTLLPRRACPATLAVPLGSVHT